MPLKGLQRIILQCSNFTATRHVAQEKTLAHHLYEGIKPFDSHNENRIGSGSLLTVGNAFEVLIARIQAIRFDHPDPNSRKKLQRVVERIRRIQNEASKLVYEK
jgi:hypothetical protein